MSIHVPASADSLLRASPLHNVYPSTRAQLVERRTYLRPLDEDGSEFETPAQMIDRVIGHQRTLWEAAKGAALNDAEESELSELRSLIEQRKVSVSGRVKWMGGTDIVKKRASGAFNCSFTMVETPADMTDVFWLLLQGCGVGFQPKTGLLTGFASTLKNVEVIASTRTDKGGAEDTISFVEGDKWIVRFGDSAKAWAKAAGILLANKPRVSSLVLDFSELRPGGKRLKGYGWLSSGWEPLARAMEAWGKLLIAKSDTLLDAVDVLDLVNWLGTVLSSRRSAQIAVLPEDHKDIAPFLEAKTDRWTKGEGQREQSNNSIMFDNRPSRETIAGLLRQILSTGEPSFVNRAEARRRAPEMEGLNPCAEILLPSKGFCNLMQVVFHRFNGNLKGLLRALWIAGRANYRQTCVSMRDGVLQVQWNDNQKLLRLCGVSPTGWVSWEGQWDVAMTEAAAEAARSGAHSMADDLGLQRPRRVTQCQPAGTSSKALGLEGDEVHEGAHGALSRWIFNNINFSRLDPLVEKLVLANYHVWPNPNDPTGVLVRVPVAYPASDIFTKVERNGETLEINLEPALRQLDRYKFMMDHYVDHNCSITVSFDEHEIEDMADWFMANWDSYVGVSFLQRNDPSKTAADLGFKYLPQEAVSRETYERYAFKLLPVDLSDDKSSELLQMDDCATGACPVR